MKSKIESITNGGSIEFKYTFSDQKCDFICKSQYIQNGCTAGQHCNVNSNCKNGLCECTLNLRCNHGASGKISNGNIEITDTSNAKFEIGGSHNSASGSAQYLGMFVRNPNPKYENGF